MPVSKPKKNLFITGIACCLLGYAGGILSTGKKTPNEEQISATQRPPRFGEVKNTPPPVPAENRTDRRIDWKNAPMDVLIAQYSKMTPDQIFEEIKRILLNRNNNFALTEQSRFALVYLAHRWGRLAPKEAMSRIQTQGGSMKTFLIPEIMNSWARTNPEAAHAYFIENKRDFPVPDQIQAVLIYEMGKASPEKALAYMENLDSKEKKRALYSILSGIIETHPEQTRKFVAQFNDQINSDKQLLSIVVKKWTTEDWPSAKKWIGERSALMGEAFGTLAQMDLDLATRELQTLPPDMRSDAFGALTISLANGSPVQALKWMEANVTEEQAAGMVYRVINYMQQQDPELHDYILSAKPGRVKDEVIRHITNTTLYQLYNIDYGVHMELISGLSSREERQSARDSTLSKWIDQSPEKAMDWIKKSSLSPTEKQQYLKSCENKIKDNQP